VCNSNSSSSSSACNQTSSGIAGSSIAPATSTHSTRLGSSVAAIRDIAFLTPASA
jgi:hypothetical protein